MFDGLAPSNSFNTRTSSRAYLHYASHMNGFFSYHSPLSKFSCFSFFLVHLLHEHRLWVTVCASTETVGLVFSFSYLFLFFVFFLKQHICFFLFSAFLNLLVNFFCFSISYFRFGSTVFLVIEFVGGD